jgi:hypothetical protein
MKFFKTINNVMVLVLLVLLSNVVRSASPVISSPSITTYPTTMASCGGNVCPLPSTCSSTDFTLNGIVHHAEIAIDKVLCLMTNLNVNNKFNPMHVEIARETHRFALVLATWVRSLLPTPHLPLKFIYYIDSNDASSKLPCSIAKSGPYVNGGGKPLCRMIKEGVTLGDSSLPDYLVQLLDMGKTIDSNGGNFWDKYKWTKDFLDQVRRIGFEIYARTIHYFDTRFVYNPKEDQFGEQLLGQVVDQYWGISGGGSSGAGFEIYCKSIVSHSDNSTSENDDNDPGELILDGGGGFGTGLNSPQPGSPEEYPVQAGGGGGGGINFRSILTQEPPDFVMGAGAGNHPYGWVQIKNTKYLEFANRMKQAIVKIQKCHSTPGKAISLTGGGSGGGGFQALKKDFSQFEKGMDLGFGFQFAMGTHTKLVNNAGGQIPFLVCPYNKINNKVPWQMCVNDGSSSSSSGGGGGMASQKTSKSPTIAPTHAFIPHPVVASCGSAISFHVCAIATYVDPKTKQVIPYGTYTSYAACMCPIQREYARDFGGRDPGPCGPTDQPIITSHWDHDKYCAAGVKLGCQPLVRCGGTKITKSPSSKKTG